MALSAYPASEAEYDARNEAQPEPKKLTPEKYEAALSARIDEIVMECWEGNPQGDYSLEEMIEQEADALAPLIIEATQSTFPLAIINTTNKLNNLMRERLAVYAQPIAEMELEGWR